MLRACGVRCSAASWCVTQRAVRHHSRGGVSRAAVAQLIANFPKTSQVKEYLRLYKDGGSQNRIIIKVSGGLLHDEDTTKQLAAAVSFLHQVGLAPIVVHGAGALSGFIDPCLQADIDACEGPTEVLDVVGSYMEHDNQQLVRYLGELGCDATGFTQSVFTTAETQNDALRTVPAKLREVCHAVESVAGGPVRDCVDNGVVPVLAAVSSIGTGPSRRFVSTFSTIDAVTALSRELQPIKVVYLTHAAGLRQPDGSLLRTGCFADGITDDVVRSEDRPLFNEIRQLCQQLPPHGTVAVTKPSKLSNELFLHKGAGSLLYQGERLFVHHTLGSVDTLRLQALMEASFGAALPANYMATLAGTLKLLIVSETYSSAAIVTTVDGVAYLDKFAVEPSQQGGRVGSSVWRALLDAADPLVWRSRSDNPVNAWYMRQAAGCLCFPPAPASGDIPWTVFWRGLAPSRAVGLAATVAQLPATFTGAAKTRPRSATTT